MSGRENTQIGEWRRGKSRNGSMVNVNFNGGGILLFGAPAAGALLAAALAVRRVSSHRRKRGMTERDPLDGIDQAENFCKHLDGVVVPKIVEDEADKAGRVDQVNSSDNFDVSHEISQVIERKSDADLLKEEDGEGAERSSSKKIELAGGVEGELACFRDSSAEICSSPVSTCNNLGICCSLLENHLRYDTEEGGMPCKSSKEEDEEDYKREIVEKSGEAWKFEEQNASPNLSREELQQLECESHERMESSLEQDNQMLNEESPMIQFKGIELATREEKVSSEVKVPLSLEPNVMEEPIQENKLKNSEKALKIEECNLEASTHDFIDAQELGICPSKEKVGSEDKAISVQSSKIETMQNTEADKNKKADGMEEEIEYHKTLPLAEMNEMPGYIQSYVGGILKETHASDTKEQEEEQAAKLSFDVVKGLIKLVSVNQKKRQSQAEKNFEKNYLKKSKQKRTTAGKEKTTECNFTGYPKGQLFMMLTLAAAFAILAIIYHDEFHHWSYHLGKNYHRLFQTFYSFYNITC